MKNFSFPVIERVQINHFSLYKKTNYLEIDLSKNVFCLAGANGLGKSTFITIINYALTGIVKNPERKFTWYNEITKFYNQTKRFASTYFDGRISEEDVDLAEVTLDFSIGNKKYSITRGFFEPDELRSFTKTVNNENITIPDDLNYTDLNDFYKVQFTKDVNLTQFDQFVFLQCFVFTFDETHQLLFWDESIMERVLYLFFGVDSGKAKTADKLRKDFNKFDSNVRNLQHQITGARNELRNVIKSLDVEEFNDVKNLEILELHKSLSNESDEVNNKIIQVAEDIKDADLNISDFSLRAASLRSEYENIFNQSLSEEIPIERDPTIIEILNDLKLRIHSEKDFTDLIEKLVETIKKQKQPDPGRSSEQYFQRLSEIDDSLTELAENIKSFQKRKDRLIDEEKKLTQELDVVAKKIKKIEKDNSLFLKEGSKDKANLDLEVIIKNYQGQVDRLSEQKDDNYEKRNKAKDELNLLEKDLNTGYINAESRFIPIFNAYAESFLGLDINLNLVTSRKGASLSLNIGESKRKSSHQLSESQRYFIDIALRMALIEFSTDSATLLVDTPEGSLDIAYESRAGKMLADFAKVNHKLIMTANINSSQLLIELANTCKSKNMKIEKMTDWTILSDVQQKENARIEDAYSKLEEHLN